MENISIFGIFKLNDKVEGFEYRTRGMSAGLISFCCGTQKSTMLLLESTYLASLWYARPSPSLNPAMRGFKLEAATRFPSILLSGSLIPIVVYRDGDGYCLAKHIQHRSSERKTGFPSALE